MRKILFFIGLMICVLSVSAQVKGTINPVINDLSYIVTHGIMPDENSPEAERIQTHLAYVEQQLRMASPTNLNSQQFEKRNAVLDHLNDYLVAGKFPKNIAYVNERRPCFIDDEGTICAVGYLIEQTSGRDAAEQINKRHQYDFLLDMNEPMIAAWAEENGLTLEECAMIQPTYGPPPQSEWKNAGIPTGYGIASGIAGGANLALGIANIAAKTRNNPALGYIGFVTGTGQLIMGLASVKKNDVTEGWYGTSSTTSYKGRNNLSYFNIALGTGTLITSAINLAINKRIKDKRNAFNFYSAPNYTNSLSMGFSFTRTM